MNVSKCKREKSADLVSFMIALLQAPFQALGSEMNPKYHIISSIIISVVRHYKEMTNLDSVLGRTDVTLPTKVHIAKVTVFPVITWSVRAGQ